MAGRGRYAVRHEPWPVPVTRSSTPTAYASFPREVRHPPRSFAAQVFNVQRWRQVPRGGHFAALEPPDLLATDVTTFRPLAAGQLTAARFYCVRKQACDSGVPGS